MANKCFVKHFHTSLSVVLFVLLDSVSRTTYLKRYSEELERERRRTAAMQIVPKPLKPEERRSLEAKRDRLMVSSEKTLKELRELGEAHFGLEQHDEALLAWEHALAECETSKELALVHTSMARA